MTYVRIRRLSAVTVLALTGAPLALSDAAKADNMLAPIWTGIYVGVQGGAQWSDIDTDFNSGFSTQGVSGGGHIGFNWGFGGLVIGAEADASLDNAAFSYSSVGNTTKLDTDWSGTLRARVGVPVGPALLYATAGYAWSDISISDKSGGLSSGGTHRFDGVVYGVGAEAYVLPNLSLRLEALHFDYGSDKISLAAATEKFDPSETVLRAGLTFHLN